MEIKKSPPEILLYSPNKKDCLGVVRSVIDFTEDIRFNSCSEISLTVSKYIYNLNTEKWELNPAYTKLTRNNLIYLTDNTEYFSFPKYNMGDENYYKYRGLLDTPDNNDMEFNQNNYLDNFRVQYETELFDMGLRAGYRFDEFKNIDDSNGEIKDHSGVINLYPIPAGGIDYGNLYVKRHACDAFVPVSAEDVIAVQGGDIFEWKVSFYTEADPTTYVGTWDPLAPGDSANYVYRHVVASELPEGGYVRFWFYNDDDNSGYCRWDNANQKVVWSTYVPDYGYAKIYSGERRCSNVTTNLDGEFSPYLHWFQIEDTEENGDGLNCKKTITAYSYEYSLRNQTFSLSSSTLPFYIPEPITDLANSDNWIIDKKSYQNISRHKQKMQRGILNQILDELPGWKIGSIPSELMTRYRQLSDVDEANIYSYLMETVQEVFNCFIIFDCDNQTISAITKDGVGMESSVYLSWNNAITSLKKNNQDSAYYTALRIHAGDDVYGMGLINPTGNNIIYNFDPIKSDLKYTVCEGQYSRTLEEAVSSWERIYNARILSYRTHSRNFIETNEALIKNEGNLSKALSEYRAKAGVINIYLQSSNRESGDISDKLISDVPRAPDDIKADNDSNYYSATLKLELYSLARAYDELRRRRNILSQTLSSERSELERIANKLTMSYKKALKVNNGVEEKHSGNTTILSALEIKALKNHIIEGNWTNHNIGFRDTYSANDIFSTLIEAYDEADYDLKHRLFQPNFDFSITSANITAVPEFREQIENLHMGNVCTLDLGEDTLVHPLLLEMHIDYKDDSNFSFTFTTDMNRKPLEFRFADLYSTISQTSVTDTTLKFDE